MLNIIIHRLYFPEELTLYHTFYHLDWAP